MTAGPDHILNIFAMNVSSSPLGQKAVGKGEGTTRQRRHHAPSCSRLSVSWSCLFGVDVARTHRVPVSRSETVFKTRSATTGTDRIVCYFKS